MDSCQGSRAGGAPQPTRRDLLRRSLAGPAAILGAAVIAAEGSANPVAQGGTGGPRASQAPPPNLDVIVTVVPHGGVQCDIDTDVHASECYENFANNLMEISCTEDPLYTDPEQRFSCIHEELA